MVKIIAIVSPSEWASPEISHAVSKTASTIFRSCFGLMDAKLLKIMEKVCADCDALLESEEEPRAVTGEDSLSAERAFFSLAPGLADFVQLGEGAESDFVQNAKVKKLTSRILQSVDRSSSVSGLTGFYRVDILCYNVLSILMRTILFDPVSRQKA